MKTMYAIESAANYGVYYTGSENENGTPKMINNVEEAKLYPILNEAVQARNELQKTGKKYNVREIYVSFASGWTVKEN